VINSVAMHAEREIVTEEDRKCTITLTHVGELDCLLIFGGVVDLLQVLKARMLSPKISGGRFE
jgi:hypothetical protein